ncbi:hypothetical protein V8F33_008500 [Rhypophila sp. PSN 637]
MDGNCYSCYRMFLPILGEEAATRLMSASNCPHRQGLHVTPNAAPLSPSASQISSFGQEPEHSPAQTGSSVGVVGSQAQKPKGGQKERKRRASKFSKRRKTLLKRSYDMFNDCDARVFCYVEKNKQAWVFTSDPEDKAFPPTKTQIMTSYPLPNVYTPLSFQK